MWRQTKKKSNREKKNKKKRARSNQVDGAAASNEPAESSVTWNAYWADWAWTSSSSSKGSVTKDEKSPGSNQVDGAAASNEPAESSVTWNTYWADLAWTSSSSSKGSVTEDEKSPGSIKSSSKVSIKSENEEGSVALIEDTSSSKKTSTIVRIDPKELFKPGTSVHERGSTSRANPTMSYKDKLLNSSSLALSRPRIDAPSSMQPPSSTPHHPINTDQDEAEGWTMVVRKKGKQKETRKFMDLRRTICNNLANRHWEQMKDYYRMGKLRGMAQEDLYQARLHRQRARRENKKASALKFHEVNRNNGTLMVIDLNGQQVEEGLEHLLDHMAFGSCRAAVRYFWVITGSGKHSVAEAKLREAVLEFMTDEGLTHEEQNPGCFLITLQDHQMDLVFNSDSE